MEHKNVRVRLLAVSNGPLQVNIFELFEPQCWAYRVRRSGQLALCANRTRDMRVSPLVKEAVADRCYWQGVIYNVFNKQRSGPPTGIYSRREEHFRPDRTYRPTVVPEIFILYLKKKKTATAGFIPRKLATLPAPLGPFLAWRAIIESCLWL